MPTQPGPYVAFLNALQDAYAASGLNPNTFTPGAQGVPGAAGQPASDAGGGTVAGGLGGGLGGGGASVPGTATTGPSLLEDILAGGDPNALQTPGLVDRLRGLEPSGIPERPDVPGGNLGALLSVIGGVGAVPTLLGSLVTTDALGLPLDPSLLSATGLAQLASDDSTPGFGAAGSDLTGATPVGPGTGFGVDRPGVATGLSFPGAPTIGGGLSFTERDRPERPERSLSRERTTGRAAGPV